MILDHVAQASALFVITTSGADAAVLRHRDLHALDVVPVPKGFENRVGKPLDQHILHRFLAEVMIDAEHLGFGQHTGQDVVQLPGRGQIATKGFFDDDL